MPGSTRRTAGVNKGKHGTLRPADNHHHGGWVSEKKNLLEIRNKIFKEIRREFVYIYIYKRIYL